MLNVPGSHQTNNVSGADTAITATVWIAIHGTGQIFDIVIHMHVGILSGTSVIQV